MVVDITYKVYINDVYTRRVTVRTDSKKTGTGLVKDKMLEKQPHLKRDEITCKIAECKQLIENE